MIGHANWEYASGRGLVGQSQSIVSHFQDRDVVASGVDSNKETSVSSRYQGILRLQWNRAWTSKLNWERRRTAAEPPGGNFSRPSQCAVLGPSETIIVLPAAPLFIT